MAQEAVTLQRENYLNRLGAKGISTAQNLDTKIPYFVTLIRGIPYPRPRRRRGYPSMLHCIAPGLPSCCPYVAPLVDLFDPACCPLLPFLLQLVCLVA